MLGTRTKQIHAYGKRGQRIINVSADADGFTSHRKAAPEETNDGYLIPSLRRPSSFLVQKSPKRPSPKKSPSKVTSKNKRARNIPVSETAKSKTDRSQKHSNLTKPSESIDPANTPRRQPLSIVHPNIIRSPSVTPACVKSRILGKGSAPVQAVRLGKQSSPVIDVDIIVLDDAGRRFSQERRVSRTDVQVNIVEHIETRKSAAVIDITGQSSDEEEYKIPERPGRRRKAIIVSSDESDSEEDEPLILQPSPPRLQVRSPPKSKLKVDPPLKQSSPLESQVIHRSKSKLKVEVVVPGAPPWSKEVPKLTQTRGHSVAASTEQRLRPENTSSLPFEGIPKNSTVDLLSNAASKPRPLTPIRRRPFAAHNSPAYFATDALDFDLSADLSSLTLDLPQSVLAEFEKDATPEYLQPLLSECDQEMPHEFSAFIESFPFDPIIQSASGSVDNILPVFRKIGEASYSEVYGIGSVVLKVIPLRDESCEVPIPNGAGRELEGPAPSDAKDVLKEIIVTRAVGEICGSGFVQLLRAYIVRGRYPELLLHLWDEYNDKKGSESIRPDTFSLSQTYAIIVLPNGGPDLETYAFSSPARNGWRQACSIFWQVARALSQAEELVAFEHRDLHWGQILVSGVPSVATRKSSVDAKSAKTMDDPAHGVKVTIIDLGLSRMDAEEPRDGDLVHWTPFEDEIFEGEGDYQFDVYRMMKNWNAENWMEFKPLTNVMWLHYLALKLLHSKRLRPPKTATNKAKAISVNVRAGFTERECYECLVEVERTLVETVAHTKKPAKSGGRKSRTKGAKSADTSQANKIGTVSAGQVVLFGQEMGWIS